MHEELINWICRARYLNPELVRAGVAFEKVIRSPFNGSQSIVELTHLLQSAFILNGAPSQHSDGERHGELVLHIVSRIVVTTGEVHLYSDDYL